MNLADFHFLRPYALLALPPLLLLILLAARRRGRRSPWRSVCDPQLLPHILSGGGGGRRWPWYGAALCALFSVLALAGPTWQRLPQPAYLNQSGLVIVLDLNAPMNAADLKPSRLVRARYKIADLLRSRHEGQTGLVVYAGDAFVVTPMTDDTNTIYSQLSVLDSSLMPSRGERADLAVDKAVSLLRRAGMRRGDVLLVAAGFDEVRLRPAVEKLRPAGDRRSVLGLGTEQGAPAPLPRGCFRPAPPRPLAGFPPPNTPPRGARVVRQGHHRCKQHEHPKPRYHFFPGHVWFLLLMGRGTPRPPLYDGGSRSPTDQELLGPDQMLMPPSTA